MAGRLAARGVASALARAASSRPVAAWASDAPATSARVAAAAAAAAWSSRGYSNVINVVRRARARGEPAAPEPSRWGSHAHGLARAARSARSTATRRRTTPTRRLSSRRRTRRWCAAARLPRPAPRRNPKERGARASVPLPRRPVARRRPRLTLRRDRARRRARTGGEDPEALPAQLQAGVHGAHGAHCGVAARCGVGAPTVGALQRRTRAPARSRTRARPPCARTQRREFLTRLVRTPVRARPAARPRRSLRRSRSSTWRSSSTAAGCRWRP
jgi:hypothetical protein